MTLRDPGSPRTDRAGSRETATHQAEISAHRTARHKADTSVRRRQRGAAIAAVGGALLALAAALVLDHEAEPEDAGGDVVERLLNETSSGAPPPAGPTAAARVRSGDLPAARESVQPERLVIPSIDAHAPVVPVGVAASGGMELPSGSTVGWYRFGPGLDATAGSIVLAGHVDSAREGRGALFRLRDVGLHDRITLHGGDGDPRAFRVIGRQIWSKATVPLDRLFARDGEPRLVLITCGGDFDRSAQRYEDNVVIVAVPENDPRRLGNVVRAPW